ncbi:MAG: hypothetical protein BM556_14015 [Bacteriovorax sp. MedPE-SWde]|nr:MAG: hypothetical protein BM556_14015 [Bacteriovorax sp. MedPE-SWde]
MNIFKNYIKDQTDIAQLILLASDYLVETGFSQRDCEVMKTVISELAYNIVKYAGKGVLTIQRISKGQNKGVEIKASDNGPGIEDVDEAMTDHKSSGDTLGLGLPSVKRMMDEFEISSNPEDGTTILTRKWL